jgi:hypothetical protein
LVSSPTDSGISLYYAQIESLSPSSIGSSQFLPLYPYPLSTIDILSLFIFHFSLFPHDSSPHLPLLFLPPAPQPISNDHNISFPILLPSSPPYPHHPNPKPSPSRHQSSPSPLGTRTSRIYKFPPHSRPSPTYFLLLTHSSPFSTSHSLHSLLLISPTLFF